MPEIVDFNKINGVFKDTSQGDNDFYTYWYSICYVVGMFNKYKSILNDIRGDEEMIRRFLISREVFFKNDSSKDTLQYLYDHWVDEISNRGTLLIHRDSFSSSEIGVSDYTVLDNILANITNNQGIGITTGSVICTPNNQFDIPIRNLISFDFSLYGDDGVNRSCDCKMFSDQLQNNYIQIVSDGVVDGNGDVVVTLDYVRSASTLITVSATVSATDKHTVKLLSTHRATYLYMDDVLIDSYLSPILSMFDIYTLITENSPILANIRVTSFDVNYKKQNFYKWDCNEGSGMWIECSSGNALTAGFTVLPDHEFDSLWVRDHKMNNTGYSGLQGELKRLINHSDGEFIYELASPSELGMVTDISSFISEEGSVTNMNKFYEKGLISKISKYPLSFTLTSRPVIYQEKIRYSVDGDYIGLNSALLANPDWRTNLEFKPNGLTPFIPVPVANVNDDFDGYEISFFIRSTKSIDIYMGIYPYDRNLEYLENAILDYETGNVSNEFLIQTDFIKAIDTDLWVRAVYSPNKLSRVADGLNIGVGDNLYSGDDIVPGISSLIKYIAPYITFKTHDNSNSTVDIWDIVIRPLSLPTSKGILGVSKSMFGYMKNDTGKSDSSVLSSIENKLIPYDISTNIKFI